MKRLLLVLLLLCPTSSQAALWTGIIDQTRAMDWTAAGVEGGITDRTTICSTIAPYNGTAATINNAIAACPSGQVVSLSAGTFNLSTGILFAGKDNVTLRGAGPDQTKLVLTGQDGCFGNTGDICVRSTNANYSNNPVGTANWTVGYARGATSITVDNVTGLSIGDFIVLDQVNDAADTGAVYMCNVISPTCSLEAGSGGRTNRQQYQYVKITAIAGSVLTITPGLAMPNWNVGSGKSPGVWWSGPQIVGVGIENLSVDHTNGTGTGGINFFNARNSWIKNIRSLNGQRNHVWITWSTHLTVQDSYFYGTKNASSTSYGIDYEVSGDSLFVNNIFHHVTTPIICGGGVGHVSAYNYAIDMFQTQSVSVMFSSWASGHDAGCEMNLIEGNDGNQVTGDVAHGPGVMTTLYRDVLSGYESGKSYTANLSPVFVASYQRFYNVIGNILGTTTIQDRYESRSPTTTGANTSIYVLDWSNCCGSNNTVNPDSLVTDTLLRWGNYDTVNAAVRWVNAEVPSGLSLYSNAVPADHTLPSSFYYSSQPSWWGSKFKNGGGSSSIKITAVNPIAGSGPAITPKAVSAGAVPTSTIHLVGSFIISVVNAPGSVAWPPIGPDVTGGDISGVGGFANKIPARLCYENTPKDGANPYLAFNATNCY